MRCTLLKTIISHIICSTILFVEHKRRRNLVNKHFQFPLTSTVWCKHVMEVMGTKTVCAKISCVCVCVCVCVCGHVYVVYEDTNLYNDMGMTGITRRR